MITLINHQGLKLIKGIQIQTPAPSIGLAYIGAYLKSFGHDYTPIDACGEGLEQVFPWKENAHIMVQGLKTPQVIERIPQNTKIIGFTCLFSHAWPLVEEIAVQARTRFPNAILVAGGEHSTAMSKNILSERIIDVVVFGEGEATFLELVECVKSNKTWKTIDGIEFINKSGQYIKNNPRRRIKEIDKIPYPDWDNWCLENYIDNQQVTGINIGRAMPILGSRGCPYICTFCSNEEMWTTKYLMRDGIGLIDEMEFMKKKYQVNGFNFMDSTFIINRKKILDFCHKLIERNLNVNYQLPAGTRCEAINTELVEALDESGLKNFALAPESGSEIILKSIKKEFNISEFLKIAKIICHSKMTVGCFFVIGFPKETKDTIRQTLSLVRKIAIFGVDDVTISMFTPYPGSYDYNKLVKNKIISEDYFELFNTISFFSKKERTYSESFTSKELYYWMLWIYLNFYIISFVLRPWKLVRNLLDYFFKGFENTRYMRLLTEIFFLRNRWKAAFSKNR